MRPGAVGCLRGAGADYPESSQKLRGGREAKGGRGWDEPLCWGLGGLVEVAAGGALAGAARGSGGPDGPSWG